MRLSVIHRTEYFYPQSASQNVNELRLTPPSNGRQERRSSFLNILPATRLQHYMDLNQNKVHHFEIHEPHQRLLIESRCSVETYPVVDYGQLPYGCSHRDLHKCKGLECCHPFLQNSPYIEVTPEAWRLGIDIQNGSEDVFQTSYAIMEYIYNHFSYRSGVTNAATHASEVLRGRAGVCQDFAHAMVAICRSLGIPARYVSGYFFDATRDHSMRGWEASHAWVEVYLLHKGWVGLDPTNNKVVDETYITLATGRDYRDVAPVQGQYHGSAHSSMNISVQVSPS